MEMHEDGKPMLVHTHEHTLCMLKQIYHDMAGNSDPVPPQAMVWFDDGTTWGARPGPATGKGVLEGSCGLDELFLTSVRSLQWKRLVETGTYPQVRRFMAASEGFVRVRGEIDEPQVDGADGYAEAAEFVLWGPSEPKHDFETNPATPWKQALTTYLATRDVVGQAQYEVAITPYWVGDDGKVVWESCMYTSSEMDEVLGQGPMHMALSLIMKGKDG